MKRLLKEDYSFIHVLNARQGLNRLNMYPVRPAFSLGPCDIYTSIFFLIFGLLNAEVQLAPSLYATVKDCSLHR